MIDTEIIDRICLLRLDAPPLNKITLELLAQLRRAIDAATDASSVEGIVITGDAAHFSAGADIRLFEQIESAGDALQLCEVFQAAFQTIESSRKPVVAALQGRVIGGALELAMACHFRIAGQSSRFTMPEVNLGINPGAGGTQRLPRLVGTEAALQMLLAAETIDARRALELGLVDEVDVDAQVVDRACTLARSHPALRRTSQLDDKTRDTSVREAAFRQAEERLSTVRPDWIAPGKILDAVRVGLEKSFEAGLACERQAFDECMRSPATRNKIYLFFATSRSGKIAGQPHETTRPLARAAIIGMGTMGASMAHAMLLSKVSVVVLESDESARVRGRAQIREWIQDRVRRNQLTPARAESLMDLLSTTSRWEDVTDCDLVVDSVVDDIRVKRSVIQQMESVCTAGTILASNSPSLPFAELAVGMGDPSRLIGMNFFSLSRQVPLMEIVRTDCTPTGTLAAVVQWSKQIHATPVVVDSRAGCLVTRLLVPFVHEAFALLQEGAEPSAIDRTAVEFGFPMGPLLLIDMAGLDILVESQRMLASALPHHSHSSPLASRLVERGRLGRETGSGIYRYAPGSNEPLECPTTAEVIVDVRRACRQNPRDVGRDEIRERLVLRLVREAFCALEEGAARCRSDVDVATVLGLGFPDFRGGALRFATDLGLDQVVVRLNALADKWGDRFAPGPLIRRQAKEGGDVE